MDMGVYSDDSDCIVADHVYSCTFSDTCIKNIRKDMHYEQNKKTGFSKNVRRS